MNIEPGRGKSADDAANQLREDVCFRAVVKMVGEKWFGKKEYNELVETMVARGHDRERFKEQLSLALKMAGKTL